MPVYIKTKFHDTSANLVARGTSVGVTPAFDDLVLGFGDDTLPTATPFFDTDFVNQFSTAVEKLASYARDNSYRATADSVWHWTCGLRYTKGTPITERPNDTIEYPGEVQLLIGPSFHGAARLTLAGDRAYWSSLVVDSAIERCEIYLRNWYLAGNAGVFLPAA